MKKIVTIAAVAALATLSACNKAEEAPAEVAATEAAANEAVANEAAPAATEVGKPANDHVEAAAPVAQ